MQTQVGADDLLEIHQVDQPQTFQQSPVLESKELDSCVFSSTVIPESKKQGKALSALPMGLLFSPFLVPDHEPLRRSPVSCSQCKAYVHCYCTVLFNNDHTASWTCTFCGQTNIYLESNEALQLGNPQREDFVELMKAEVDYIDPTQQPYLHRSNSSPIILFVVDGNISKQDMKEFSASLGSVLNEVPDGHRIGFITFSSIVSLYEMNRKDTISCEVYPGLDSVSMDSIENILSRKNRFLAPIESARENVKGILAYLSFIAEEKAIGTKPSTQRAFGVAVQLALQLVKESNGEQKDGCWVNAPGGQIISFLTGCPNYGLGGVLESFSAENEIDYRVEQGIKFYREQAALARKNNYMIDIYCVGLKNFRVRVLQNLVLSNGGSIVLLKEFSDPQLLQNLSIGINRTQGLRGGSFDITTSRGIKIGHIIGPAAALPAEQSNNDTDHCLMSSIQKDFSYAIYYSISELIVTDSVYFQFVVEFFHPGQEKIVRVITQRIFVSDSLGKIIPSLNAKAIAVLLAKKLILESRKVPVSETSSVITKLDRIVSKLFMLFQKQDSLGLLLRDVPRLLFLLRRGPLLGPILQHSDDIDYCRCLFLQSSPRICLRFLDPPFYEIQNGDISLLPLEDLALQSNKVLLLDQHTDILIWYGSKPTEQTEKWLSAAHAIANERAQGRYPQPYIMQFKENTSMARWLLCRLIPSHKDPREAQFNSFPALKYLSEQEYQLLIRKFHNTDDFSFLEYTARVQSL